MQIIVILKRNMPIYHIKIQSPMDKLRIILFIHYILKIIQKIKINSIYNKILM